MVVHHQQRQQQRQEREHRLHLGWQQQQQRLMLLGLVARLLAERCVSAVLWEPPLLPDL